MTDWNENLIKVIYSFCCLIGIFGGLYQVRLELLRRLDKVLMYVTDSHGPHVLNGESDKTLSGR